MKTYEFNCTYSEFSVDAPNKNIRESNLFNFWS